MARWNNDKALDYEEELRKKKEQANVYLPEFAVKLQEKANRVYIPPPPLANSEHSEPDIEYKILDEIRRIHQLIKEHGEQGDFGMQMKFGKLLPLYGSDQVDRLSEVLANARKNGYINYTLKDFLQQDRDDDVWIRAIKTPF